jgi:hypothetical protein
MSSTYEDSIITVQEDTLVSDKFSRQVLKINTVVYEEKNQTSVPRDNSSSVFSMIVEIA